MACDPAMKAALLALLDDPDVRAKLLAVVISTLEPPPCDPAAVADVAALKDQVDLATFGRVLRRRG